MSDLINLSKTRRIEADQLLEKSELIPLLKQFGEVVITGSYKHDLMLTPDLDLYVITPNDTFKTAAEINSKMVQQQKWNGYMLFDWHQFRKPYFPDSYYVGAQTPFAGNVWRADIWVLNELTQNIVDFNKWITENFKEEHRIPILKIKNERDLQKSMTSSYDIYKAVIENNAKSLNDVIKIQETKKL